MEGRRGPALRMTALAVENLVRCVETHPTKILL